MSTHNITLYSPDTNKGTQNCPNLISAFQFFAKYEVTKPKWLRFRSTRWQITGVKLRTIAKQIESQKEIQQK